MADLIKVLHVSTPRSWRGGEQQIGYLLEGLPGDQVNNLVMTPQGSKLAEFCERNGFHLKFLPKGGLANLSNPFRLKTICDDQDIDLIHLHDAHAHTLAIYSAVLAKLPVPLVLSRRVDFPIKSNSLSYFKYNHAQVKAIVCVSEAIKRILREQINNPEKLEVIHDGIDLGRFIGKEEQNRLRLEWSVPENYQIIGNVAAIADHKDLYTFVDTAEYLFNQGLKARFFIIGDGPQREAIQGYINEKGLGETILITGFREDISQILPELDLYLMTSKTEGLGTSVLDAFVAGVPVVATEAGGIPEMVSHEENGLLAEVGDIIGLGDAVLRLDQNESLKDRLVKRAREQVKAFSKEKMAEKTLLTYQSVVNEL